MQTRFRTFHTLLYNYNVLLSAVTMNNDTHFSGQQYIFIAFRGVVARIDAAWVDHADGRGFSAPSPLAAAPFTQNRDSTKDELRF